MFLAFLYCAQDVDIQLMAQQCLSLCSGTVTWQDLSEDTSTGIRCIQNACCNLIIEDQIHVLQRFQSKQEKRKTCRSKTGSYNEDGVIKYWKKLSEIVKKT